MTKNDTNRRTIQGRLWGCSRNLSSAKNFHITFPESEMSATLEGMAEQSVRVDVYDWLTVYNLKPLYFESLPECEITKLYREKIRSIQRGYSAEKTFFYGDQGEPLSFEQAKEMSLPKSAEMLYEEQTQDLFNSK